MPPNVFDGAAAPDIVQIDRRNQTSRCRSKLTGFSEGAQPGSSLRSRGTDARVTRATAFAETSQLDIAAEHRSNITARDEATSATRVPPRA